MINPMNKYVSMILLCAPIWLASIEKAEGQVVVNSDGTHSVVTGNVVVNSDGTHSVITGNVVVNPNGTHSVIAGNVIVSPNGSHSVISDNASGAFEESQSVFPERKKRQLANGVMLSDSLDKKSVTFKQWLNQLFRGN